MAREGFVPSTILNVPTVAWIRYRVHDWFSHGKSALTRDGVELNGYFRMAGRTR